MSSLLEWMERSIAFLAAALAIGALGFFAMRLLA